MSNQPSSPEPLWLLSEPWPAGQTQLLGCVRNQTSVFAGGIESQKASLHGLPWSLTCSYFEPTNSHQDALWEMLFLSAVLLTCHFSLAGSTPSLPWFNFCLLSSLDLFLSLVLLLFFLPPSSYCLSLCIFFSLSSCLPLIPPTLQNTYIAIHSEPHRLQGEVFNWYIMSLEYLSD